MPPSRSRAPSKFREPVSDWLTARPVAHRGLHDAAAGVIENTPSAFRAAIAANYAIECDVQLSADGEAMVHHDDTLGRLTDGSGRLDAQPATELKRVPFLASADHMITLGELCDLVAGRVALIVEVKSRFDGDERLPMRVAKVLGGYAGPAAAMSFDPGQVGALKNLLPPLLRGLVAQQRERGMRGEHDSSVPSSPRYAAQALAAGLQFLAYRVQDLPSAMPLIARHVFGMPLLTWTVRTSEQRARAARHADQIIFEGFRP
jgi:glycerophosphoryl diester phosphodiesterase